MKKIKIKIRLLWRFQRFTLWLLSWATAYHHIHTTDSPLIILVKHSLIQIVPYMMIGPHFNWKLSQQECLNKLSHWVWTLGIAFLLHLHKNDSDNSPLLPSVPLLRTFSCTGEIFFHQDPSHNLISTPQTQSIVSCSSSLPCRFCQVQQSEI